MVFLLAATVFLAEVLVMGVLLAALPPIQSPVLEALLDATLLCLIIGPALFILGFRPLARQILQQAQIEAELRETQDGLERRVAERTEDLSKANTELTDRMAELKRNSAMLRVLTQASGLLQACDTSDDTRPVLSASLAELFPNDRGCLFLFRNSRDSLEPVAAWGGDEPEAFSADSCWAIKLGRQHTVGMGGTSVACGHHEHPGDPSICVPLSAQGDVLGVLQIHPGAHHGRDSIWQDMLELTCGEFAMGLANVKLREKLHVQAVRDPLTGLYNRRYLIEAMTREFGRAERSGSPLSVLMLDVDHFKKLNDAYGHAAGDLALKRISALIEEMIRAGDIACRYGGEEFAIVLLDAAQESALRRADEIRDAIQKMRIEFLGTTLSQITVSIGVATYPTNGFEPTALISRSDAAMYQAKAAGRNRVAAVGAAKPTKRAS